MLIDHTERFSTQNEIPADETRCLPIATKFYLLSKRSFAFAVHDDDYQSWYLDFRKRKGNESGCSESKEECFSFTFHVAERERERENENMRREEEREKVRTKEWIWEWKRGTTTERTAVRVFLRLDKELDRSPVLLIRKQFDNYTPRAGSCLELSGVVRVILKRVDEFSDHLYQ